MKLERGDYFVIEGMTDEEIGQMIGVFAENNASQITTDINRIRRHYCAVYSYAGEVIGNRMYLGEEHTNTALRNRQVTLPAVIKYEDKHFASVLLQIRDMINDELGL